MSSIQMEDCKGSFAVYLKHHGPMEREEHPKWTQEMVDEFLYATWFELDSEQEAYAPHTLEEIELAKQQDARLLREVGSRVFRKWVSSDDMLSHNEWQISKQETGQTSGGGASAGATVEERR